MKGRFITIEGLDGVGKSFHARNLAAYLTAQDVQCVCTREPGGTAVSEAVRSIILNPAYGEMDDVCELLLYCAARRQNVAELIVPNLEKGVTVICDRFIHSTIAYQCYGRGISREVVDCANAIALNGLSIDATLCLMLPSKAAFERKGGADGDRLESGGDAFYKNVERGFREMCNNGEMTAIDASGSKEQTQERILLALKEKGVL